MKTINWLVKDFGYDGTQMRKSQFCLILAYIRQNFIMNNKMGGNENDQLTCQEFYLTAQHPSADEKMAIFWQFG